MPDRLAAAYAINARLQAAITRTETPIVRRRTGGRALPVMRHRVEGQIVRDIALPRYLVWRSYLSTRTPTRASVARALHHLRGILFARYAQWAHAQGLPLPSDHAPPTWALRTTAQRMRKPTVTRKDVEKWLNPDEFRDIISDDMAAWWDVFGWEPGIPAADWDAVSAEQRALWQREALDSVTADFAFRDWIATEVLGNLQVLQILETYWNGQGAMFAGQELLTTGGIAGNFNIEDPMMMGFLQNQAGAFVTRIDERTRQQLAEYLWSGFGGDVAQGVPVMSVDALAKYLQGGMNAWENGLAGMSEARARMIAITETARAETFGQFVAMLGSGVQKKEWLVTTGACIKCQGNASMGPIPIRDEFPTGDLAPPGHPLCLPGTAVVGGPPVLGSTTRWYEGELCEIRTRGGHVLSTTPNHPILTPQGWVAIQCLGEGDQVVCGTFRQSSLDLTVDHPNDDQRPALIQDVAKSFRRSGGVSTYFVKTSAKDLHGDAMEGQVCVVRTNRLLRHHRHTAILQPTRKQLLGHGHVRRPRLHTLGYLTLRFPRARFSTHSIVRRHRVAPIFGRAALPHHEAVGVGNIAQWNVCPHQDAMNNWAADSVSRSERFFGLARQITAYYLGMIKVVDGTTPQLHTHLNKPLPDLIAALITERQRDMAERFPSMIALDEIIQVNRRSFTGHVFNLETSAGWYIAKDSVPHMEIQSSDIGVITHNCRCSLVPAIPDGAFNPDDWAYAPDPAQMERLFNDPSFMQWPRGVVDLSDPVLQMAPPTEQGVTQYVGRFTYDDLPPDMRDLIDKRQFDAGFYTDAWNQAMQGMGRAVNQAAQVDATVKAAEDVAAFTPSAGGGKVLTLDDILAQAEETPAELEDFRERLQSTLGDALADFRASLEEMGDGE